MNLRFEVHGMPACKGSWRPVRNKHTGKTFMKADDESESAWAQQVGWAARAALRNNCQPDGRRYAVRLEFGLLPPPNKRKTNRRDIDKLCRSILDSLTGLIWIDDEQVDVVHLSKIVTDSPGVVVTVESI